MKIKAAFNGMFFFQSLTLMIQKKKMSVCTYPTLHKPVRFFFFTNVTFRKNSIPCRLKDCDNHNRWPL